MQPMSLRFEIPLSVMRRSRFPNGHSMKLYYFPGACSLAAHIVLEWIGAPYEAIKMSRESVKAPGYLAINKGGTVPLLLHGEFSLTENVAILGYLADLHPDAQLLGDGAPRARAEVMRWLGFLNSDVHQAFKPIFTPTRFLQNNAFAGALAGIARNHVREYLERLDTQLEGRDWLTGTRSVADPYLYVILRWALSTQVGLTGFKYLSRFLNLMDTNRGVRAAVLAEERISLNADCNEHQRSRQESNFNMALQS
jgi:glutathione S-transferase